MKKTFDCIDMKRAASLKIHKKLKGLSTEERVAYWEKRHQEIQEELKQLNTKRNKNSNTPTIHE